MTDEEQKAWDMFAAAALMGMSTKVFDADLKDRTTGKRPTWEAITENVRKAADTMMEQRKARMG